MRTRTIALLVAAVVAAAAIGGWWWLWHEPARTLEPGWPAVVWTIAGGGDGGPAATTAHAIRFSDPFGIASAPDGTIYVADGAGSDRIVRITPDGAATTFAGATRGFADGSGSQARFSTPSGLALDAQGNLYVADTGNDAIRRVAPDGTVSTLAGPGAGLRGPIGVTVDPRGRVIVADTYNDRIVAISPDGTVAPLAGTGEPGFEDGPQARFDTPCGVAVDTAGNIYVADTGNGAVRVIWTNGNVTTIAPAYPGDSFRPQGIAIDASGLVYVAGGRGRVLEISTDGQQRLVAGSSRGFADGRGAEAMFRDVSAVAVAGPGRLVVTDRRNGLIRLVAAPSQLALRAPSPPLSPAFDAAAFDLQPLLWPFSPLEGPFEVTGTLGEPRGGEGSERLHAGLDVHAPEGTPVRVVRAAVADEPLATSSFGTLNESVRIGPIAYIHLRVGRDVRGNPLPDDRFVVTTSDAGEVTGVRLKRGAIFSTGEVIGTVNRFYHAHINVGWPGEELNPLRFGLAGFEDTIAPTIVRNGVSVLGDDGVPLKTRDRRRLIVDGRVRIVVDAYDQADGNQRRRRLGLYTLGYQLLDADGGPVESVGDTKEMLRFDRHPGDGAAARIVYASGSGIPVYGARSSRFLYLVTSTLRDGVASDGVLDTTALPPGDYTLRIVAADIAGNEAVANRDLAITIPEVPLPR